MIGADDIKVLLAEFEGWTLEKADVSPPPDPINVIRLRAPDGRVSWVALSGAFGMSAITAWKLEPGHRVLARIEHAKWQAEQRARTARLVERRAASMPAESADDCPPHGIPRSAAVQCSHKVGTFRKGCDQRCRSCNAVVAIDSVAP